MPNLAFVRENEMHRLLWDHLISAGRPDLEIVKRKKKKKKKRKKKKKENKRICRQVDFAVPADHRVKSKGSENRGKHPDFARELKTK